MFGAFGDDARTLPDTAFFRWFKLTVRTRPRLDCDRYQPEGSAFRERVMLDVELAPPDRIASLVLHVDRSFIDDERQGAFAADIVASFLETAAEPGADADDVAPLVAALRHVMTDRPGVLVRVRTPAPVLPPDVSSPILQAYQGNAERAELVLSQTRIRVENVAGVTPATKDAFRVAVCARDAIGS